MPVGQDFPVADYYKAKIVGAEALSRSGTWWSGVLTIEDPKSGERFMGLYRWQKVDGNWKTRNKFRVKSKDDALRLVEVVNRLSNGLKND